MSIWEAVILGIIQGLTEFLPVSSSGHIELGKALLDIKLKDNLTFTVVVHGATVLSTIVVFYKEIWLLIQEAFRFKWNENTSYIMKLFISAAPVAVVGLLFEKDLEALFEGRIVLVGFALLFTAFILYLTTFAHVHDKKVNVWRALVIGAAQAVAIIPGVSRSGATIGTALILNVDKARATQFSFLMVLMPIMGATLLKIKDLADAPPDDTLGHWPIIAGFIAAFVAGLFACRWMIGIVKSGKIVYFAIYCFIVGLIAIASGFF